MGEDTDAAAATSVKDFLARFRRERSASEPTPTQPAHQDLPSIHAYIVAHTPPTGPGLLEGGDRLPDEVDPAGGIAWAPGAMDGVLSHHMGGDPSVKVDDLVRRVERAASGDPRALEQLEIELRTVEALTIVDPLLDAVVARVPADRLAMIGRYLAVESGARAAVKLGIAFLGASGDPTNREILMTLGRHDEFSLFSAVALQRTQSDPETALWELARTVSGWGRIHLVERLRSTERPDIRAWILREGYRNDVMVEYLAHIAVTTGDLRGALDVAEPDDELLAAACDLVMALVSDFSPAETIDDYDEAPRAIELLLGHVATRGRAIPHLLAVDAVERFLADDDARWAEREATSWPPGLRAELLGRCAAIRSQPAWIERVERALDTEDRAEFWGAEQAARILGMDPFTAIVRQVERDPIEGPWYQLLQAADDARIDQVVRLAETHLPLAEIATGPALELGLGPGFRPFDAVGHVVEGLQRFPGRGWSIIAAALRSPVIRHRHAALRALADWPRADRPAEVEAALRAAAAIEPDDDVRERIGQLLS